jgi:hypothetical protein
MQDHPGAYKQQRHRMEQPRIRRTYFVSPDPETYFEDHGVLKALAFPVLLSIAYAPVGLIGGFAYRVHRRLLLSQTPLRLTAGRSTPSMNKIEYLEDGPERAAAAIRAEVVAEFESQLSIASFWERWRLWRAIKAEVKRRLESRAPRDALYVSDSRA